MRIEIIRTSRQFEKQYKKLPQRIKENAKEKERVFRENPFDPRLKTHKLHGREKDIWAFSVTWKYRIKFILTADAEALFLEIGAHDIYH